MDVLDKVRAALHLSSESAFVARTGFVGIVAKSTFRP
jgi:hypothetical protein